MSGWTTITAVPVDMRNVTVKENYSYMFDDDEYVGLKKVINKVIRNWGTENGVHVKTGVVNGGHDNAAFARIGGYRTWAEDYDMIVDNISSILSHVVVIHANDTSDDGEARLYQMDDGSLTPTDRYLEKERRDGRPVGEKAAAYMYFHHDVPAISRLERTYHTSEQDNYDEL